MLLIVALSYSRAPSKDMCSSPIPFITLSAIASVELFGFAPTLLRSKFILQGMKLIFELNIFLCSGVVRSFDLRLGSMLNLKVKYFL